MKNEFGEFPFLIKIPPNTPEEDAAITQDNAEFAPAHFVNYWRVSREVWTRRVLASFIAKAFIPAILLLLGALALGWRP